MAFVIINVIEWLFWIVETIVEFIIPFCCETLVNTPSKHEVWNQCWFQCWPTVCDPGTASNQHWINIGPTLYKCYTNVLCLLGIAAGLVLLTAGGDDKPTPTQCLVNVGPASPVLASIHSVLVSTSYCRYLHAGVTGTML